jgi:hypothetical protein
MLDPRYDVLRAFSIAVPVTVTGWILVRMRRDRLAWGITAVVAIFYSLVIYGAFSGRGGFVGIGILFGAPVALILGVAGILVRKVTPKAPFLLSQIFCWVFVSVPGFILILAYGLRNE